MPDADEMKRLAIVTDSDPLLANIDLPLRTIYFPLGFPLEVASNSADVMTAAEESWGRFQLKFAATPLRLRIGVTEDDDCPGLPAAPACRMQWNLLSNIADGRNFVVCDLKEGHSFGWVTQATAATPLYLRYFMLEAAAMSMLSCLRAAPMHAACVSLGGKGVLLCGDSGAGKSTLAFACARAGWTFTSDDASYVPLGRNDRMIVGNSHLVRFRSSGALLFPELEGRTVTPRAAGKPSIEIQTSELPELITADSAYVHYIVFLNRQQGCTPRLEALACPSPLQWFSRCLLPQIEAREEQEAAIRRLLEADTFELQYEDLDSAVERLQQLVQTGR